MVSGGAVNGAEVIAVEGGTVDGEDPDVSLDGGSSDLATVFDARVVDGSGANTTEALVVVGPLASDAVGALVAGSTSMRTVAFAAVDFGAGSLVAPALVVEARAGVAARVVVVGFVVALVAALVVPGLALETGAVEGFVVVFGISNVAVGSVAAVVGGVMVVDGVISGAMVVGAWAAGTWMGCKVSVPPEATVEDGRDTSEASFAG